MQFQSLSQRLRLALKEDAVSSDLTTLAIPKVRSSKLKAIVLAKAKGVLSGAFLAPLVFKQLDKKARVRLLKKDGTTVRPGDRVAIISCSAPALLGGERTFLNLLCHLSGVATSTRKFVDSVKGTKAAIVDTRKTTPLWRDLEKQAVIAGGGENHRFSLGDAVLVKDNHHQLLRKGGPRAREVYGAGSPLRRKKGRVGFVAIEAATLPQVWEAIKARPDIILLDNMPINRIKASIVFIKAAREALSSDKPLIEISGGVTLQNSKQYALLGVDRISIGAMTHSAPALDFSLEVTNGGF